MSFALAGKPLVGQVALVTGASRRIGREIAWQLADSGANVAITYRRSQLEADLACIELERLGARALAVFCDLDDDASIEPALERVSRELGPLDLLVNSAGSFETAALEEITATQWDAMFSANTRGPFLVAKAAHAALKKGRGSIINIGSLGGTRAWATHGHYCASKAALHMLSQTMAKAWAPEISVNCVAPGMIAIDETDRAYEALARRSPMQRNGTAGDVAAAVLFFATCPAFITGQILAVDGGLGL